MAVQSVEKVKLFASTSQRGSDLPHFTCMYPGGANSPSAHLGDHVATGSVHLDLSV